MKKFSVLVLLTASLILTFAGCDSIMGGSSQPDAGKAIDPASIDRTRLGAWAITCPKFEVKYQGNLVGEFYIKNGIVDNAPKFRELRRLEGKSVITEDSTIKVVGPNEALLRGKVQVSDYDGIGYSAIIVSTWIEKAGENSIQITLDCWNYLKDPPVKQ